MRRALPALLLLLVAAASPARPAAVRYLAFGDSLTAGIGDPDANPGYPPKLQRILRNEEGLDATVENWGQAGETTFEGLPRIDAVLARGGDGVLIMEGTNDVTLIYDGLLSVETTITNLERMGDKARARGFDVYYGTVIPRPPTAKKDRSNTYTREVNWEIYELASRKVRPFADGWSRMNPFVDRDVFSTLYSREADDTVGHLNGEGYEELARLFADQIAGHDVLAPVPGRFVPFVSQLDSPTSFTITLFESAGGEGIKLNQTELLVNGTPVASPVPSSSKRRAVFEHSANLNQLGCRAAFTVRGRDQAEPPNEFSHLVWVYSIAGQQYITGDVDADCEIDADDLAMLAEGFGTEFGDTDYSILLDFNFDDVVDGLDLARLAASFGASSE